MITLITGVPGAGKTAWLISQLLKLQITQPHRRLLAHGIKEFKLSHVQIYCRNPKCEICGENELVIQSLKYKDSVADEFNHQNDLIFVEDWPLWKKPSDLIVIDEVQRAWTTKAGTPMDSIALLDTHRHHGLDFWLLTQSPKLVHVDVRVMVSRHIHLAGKWNGRKEYEWPACRENVLSTSDAVERPYTLPKKVYKYYKSAEVHTKLEQRKPISFYATIIVLLLAGTMCVYAFNRVTGRIDAPPLPDQAHKPTESGAATAAAGEGGAVASKSSRANIADPVTYDDYIKSMTPVVPGHPWTAPIYKEIAKPVSFPIMQGCILIDTKDDKRCQCYSQQNTVIYTRPEVCRTFVQQRPFNHFLPDKGSEQGQMMASNDNGVYAPKNQNRQKFGSNVPH